MPPTGTVCLWMFDCCTECIVARGNQVRARDNSENEKRKVISIKHIHISCTFLKNNNIICAIKKNGSFSNEHRKWLKPRIIFGLTAKEISDKAYDKSSLTCSLQMRYRLYNPMQFWLVRFAKTPCWSAVLWTDEKTKSCRVKDANEEHILLLRLSESQIVNRFKYVPETREEKKNAVIQHLSIYKCVEQRARKEQIIRQLFRSNIYGKWNERHM